MTENVSFEIMRRAFRPMANYCLRNGLLLQNALEALKMAFIDAAEDEILANDTKVNMSKISVMSGVHRPDVKRLYVQGQVSDELPTSNVAAKVIGHWENDKRFTTKSGKPKALTFGTESSEFAKLVSAVTTSLSTGTVLFELERSGTIERSRDKLKLVSTQQDYDEGEAEYMDLLCRNIDSMVEAAEENAVDPPKPPHSNLRTEFDNLFVSDLPKIRRWVQKESLRFHKSLRQYLSKFDRDMNPERDKPAGGMAILGSFSFITDPLHEEDED